VKEGRLVTREQLDRVCPNKPVFMIKYDGHACVVNTLLLNKIKDKVKNLRGYHEESGEMNQDAFFAVSDYVTNLFAQKLKEIAQYHCSSVNSDELVDLIERLVLCE